MSMCMCLGVGFSKNTPMAAACGDEAKARGSGTGPNGALGGTLGDDDACSSGDGATATLDDATATGSPPTAGEEATAPKVGAKHGAELGGCNGCSSGCIRAETGGVVVVAAT